MSGATLAMSVGFSSATLSGKTLMDCSHVEYLTERSGVAMIVCQIDREPAHPTTCAASNQPRWALFVFSAGRWSQPGVDFAGIELHDGEGMGWHYVSPMAGALLPPPQPG